MKFNTLAEVPAAITSFYTENVDGEETHIVEIPRQDLKSWSDVELVKAKGRVPVVTHFITKACESDNWVAHDKYIAWLEKEPLVDDEKYLLTALVDDVETLVHSLEDDTTNWQSQEPTVTLRDANPLITAYATERDEIAAKAVIDAQKLAGIDYNGIPVSLTEENQNGLSSVMGGAKLAAEYGGSIFPLNFNAATATGVQTITFADLSEFELFALGFMQARQGFFS